jgi:hypothetical protein
MFEIIDEIRPHKADRMLLREKVAVVLGAICTAVLLFLAVAWSTKAYADPIYRASEGPVSITLTDEACRLPAVGNLQKRAVWREHGKDTEGCYGGHPSFPIVLAYFADRSVVALPVQIFVPVTGV